MITATEAKSAALQDLDVRSTYSSDLNQATGTGTDNIIVVEGTGQPIELSGGHSKMGELIGSVVYEGVQRAVHLQNGLVVGRSVFQRLKERKISLFGLCAANAGKEEAPTLRRRLELLLLDPVYDNFLKSAMAVSDDYEKGLVSDLSAFDEWCRTIAARIGGSEVTRIEEIQGQPKVLAKALGALFSGARMAESAKR
jgi:hypothetical protein